MGNSMIGAGRNKAVVMKITGETFKVKIPILVSDVIRDYPGHDLLESDMVERFGIRAKPLKPEEELKAKKIYSLVELPKLPDSRDETELEFFMLSRKSGSDLSAERQSSGGPLQVKMKLPRAQLEKMIQDSREETELAERIVHLCTKNL